MGTRSIVNATDQPGELRDTGDFPAKSILRIAAKIISVIFHPVFVPVYIVWFLVYIHPYEFASFSDWEKTKAIIMAILMFTFFPVVTILLLRALNFINSIYLITQKDRIIPYITCMIWYFWIAYVWHSLPDPTYPPEAVIFTMAVFIASIIGLMANIYMKISMHAIAMGVMVSFIMMLAFTQSVSFGVYISVALLITGLVCTARCIVSDHSPKEIYGGLLAGIIALLLGAWSHYLLFGIGSH